MAIFTCFLDLLLLFFSPLLDVAIFFDCRNWQRSVNPDPLASVSRQMGSSRAQTAYFEKMNE